MINNIAVLGDREKKYSPVETIKIFNYVTQVTAELPKDKVIISSWMPNAGISIPAFDWAFTKGIPTMGFGSQSDLQNKIPIRLTAQHSISDNPMEQLIECVFAAVVFSNCPENLEIIRRLTDEHKQVFNLSDAI
jgi:hypothetical protein